MSGPGKAKRSAAKPNFLILVTGQIETIEIISVSNLYCKYSYVYGPEWKQVSGLEEGLSPTSYKGPSSNEIVLNTPIEATFSSNSPFKWPQLVMSFYGQDLFGNDVVRGYSVTHLPTVPGMTARMSPVFVPEPSTRIQRIIGFFIGRRAEFVDPTIIASSEGREVTRVSTRGIVKVNFRVILKDLKKLGYDVTPSTVLRLSEFPILDKDANWSQHKKQQEPTSSEIEKEQDATSREETQVRHNVETIFEDVNEEL